MRVRAMIALGLAGLWLLLLAPASSAGAYPATTCPTLSVSTTNPLAGASITVTGKRFAPDATIRLELHSQVYVLATVTSDVNGAFSTEVTLPAGVTGTHDIVAIGGDVSGATGCPPNPFQTLNIQSQGGPPNGGGPGSGGGTAFTGIDVLALLAAAAALIAAGVLFNRRGHTTRV